MSLCRSTFSLVQICPGSSRSVSALAACVPERRRTGRGRAGGGGGRIGARRGAVKRHGAQGAAAHDADERPPDARSSSPDTCPHKARIFCAPFSKTLAGLVASEHRRPRGRERPSHRERLSHERPAHPDHHQNARARRPGATAPEGRHEARAGRKQQPKAQRRPAVCGKPAAGRLCLSAGLSSPCRWRAART